MFSLEAKIEKVYCKMIKDTESEEREENQEEVTGL